MIPIPSTRCLPPSAFLLAACTLFAFTACARRTATRIDYPPTPEGAALRSIYESNANNSKEANDAYQELLKVKDPAARTSLTSAILQIIRNGDPEHALSVVPILYEFDPAAMSSTPELTRLLPQIARALRRGNEVTNSSTGMSSIGGAFIVARMSRAAVYPIRREIFDCFNAKVAKPIEGESNDCWTKAILATLLPAFGDEGVDALVRGLNHPDPWVRVCAVGNLCGTGELGSLADSKEITGWSMSPQQVTAFYAASRRHLPEIQLLLSDQDNRVREAAIRAIAKLFPPAESLPLFEKLARETKNDQTRRFAQSTIDRLKRDSPPATRP